MAADRKRLEPLTGIRFFAAFWVVLFHFSARFYASVGAPGDVKTLTRLGFLGVDLFFVLSGFIIAFNYLDQHAEMNGPRHRFWWARFARIYPIYVVAMLLATPFFIVSAIAANGIVGGIERVLVIGFATATFTQSLTPVPALLSWNVPAWSLSAEALFYLLFPFLPWQRLPKSVGGLLMVAGGIWVLQMLLPSLYVLLRPDGTVMTTPSTVAFWLDFVKFFPLLHLGEFAIGVCAARVFALMPTPRKRVARSLTAIVALITVLAVYYSHTLPYPMVHDGLLAPLFAILIVLLAYGHGPIAGFLAWKPVRFLGEASYGIYILQMPVSLIAYELLSRIVYPLGVRNTAALEFWVVVASIVLTASITMVLLERPARKWLRARMPQDLYRSLRVRLASLF